MRCIPEEPDFQEGHHAEKSVWDALRAQLPDDVVLAHSVQVRHGRVEHEIDILVLWPGVGLAAIEVKGGQVSIQNGQWHQSDATGKHKARSPLAQSQNAQHAFVKWLAPRMGTPVTSRFPYLAAFPYTDVPDSWEMTGIPRGLILDRDDVANAAAEKIRTAIEREGQAGSGLAPAFLDRFLPHLAGDSNRTVGPPWRHPSCRTGRTT